MAGNHILTACKEAVEMARREACNVEFDFNEITLTATPTTDAAALALSYSTDCARRHQEYLASPQYRDSQERAAIKERERKAKVEAVLVDAPTAMTLRDADGWKKTCEANQDGYGGAVMTYAERWARMMEARIGKGEKLPAVADECSHLADEEGITGFMFGCAVSILAQVWIHGEELRAWHKLSIK